MADDFTVGLLQEIRDQQKKHTELLQSFIEGQQQGLANQQQSLAVQQMVVEKQKAAGARSFTLWLFVLASIFVLFFLALCPISLKQLLGR